MTSATAVKWLESTGDLALCNLEPLSASVSSFANQRKWPIMISNVFLVWKHVMQLNASLGAMSIRESIQNILNVVNSTESNCPYYIFKRKMLRTDWVALENMKQITNESNLTVRLEGTTSNYCHSKHSTSCCGKMVMHGPLVSGTVIQYGGLSQAQWSNVAACLRCSDPMGPLVSGTVIQWGHLSQGTVIPWGCLSQASYQECT